MVMLFVLVILGLGAADNVDKTLFGSKTAYDWVRVPMDDSPNIDMFVEYKGRSCKAVHVNMVLRHGYRLPGSHEVTAINKIANKFRTYRRSGGVFDFLDTWRLSLESAPGMLNALGRQEMADIGSRTTRRFKQLISNAKSRIELISTSMNRSIESAICFSKGLLTEDTSDVSEVLINNTLLRIYRECPHYSSVIASQVIADKEFAFTSSSSFRDLIRRIEEKIGVENGTFLTQNEVRKMWQFCAFDMLNGIEEHWCSAMDNQDRTIVEYAQDLEYYFDYSYGNGVSGDIHCVVLQKLFQLMDDAKTGHSTGSNNYKVGSFMFGHSGTLLGTLTALGLFQDNPPLSENNMIGERLFKMSNIAPMSGNIGFAMYACEDTKKDGNSAQSVGKTQYAVKLFFNERELEIPQFNSSMCWYDEFKQAVGGTVNCDIDTLCKKRGSPFSVSNKVNKAPVTKCSIVLAVLMAFLFYLVVFQEILSNLCKLV